MPMVTSGKLFSRLSRRVARLLFPPHCAAGGSQLDFQRDGLSRPLHFCPLCTQRLSADLADCCRICGAHCPRSGIGLESARKPCRYCRGVDFPVEGCGALGNYGDLLQRLVVQMKGHRSEVLALQLGQLLGRRLRELNWISKVEALVPVPVHWSKQLQKGFHGAAVIAEGIRRELGIPWLPRAVSSTRRTAKQGMLETAERYRNVAGAFAPRIQSELEDKCLLIVDDVLTSGATMTAVAEALRDAGAGKLYAAVLARGIRSAV